MNSSKVVILFSTLLLASAALADGSGDAGRQRVSFDNAPAYAAADIVAKRLMLPTAFASVQQAAREQGQNLHALTLTPKEESWLIYAPDDYNPQQAYGVVVGVSSSPEPALPDQWRSAFKSAHLIFVTARKADRNSQILERRIPMALIGLNGVVHRYHVDPSRIYVFGAGEAAQVAASVAIGYGDVFSGGIFLNPQFKLGSKQIPMPAEPISRTLAKRARFVFLHTRDSFDRRKSHAATESFKERCIAGVTEIALPRGNNVPAIQATADESLAFLDQGSGDNDIHCVDQWVDKAHKDAERISKMIDNGNVETAKKALVDMQLEFGSLDAEDVLKLNARLETDN